MAAVIETLLTDMIQRTRDVKSFRFAFSGADTFQAGQFFGLTLKVNGQDQTKCFSFSSSPTEKNYIEFTKKITSSDFSRALEAMKAGDRVRIKMPLGSFMLDENAGKAAFLSGGIGITPIRSMWKYAFDKGLPVNAVLLYGNHTPQDIVFRDELQAMADANKNFKVVFSIDTPDACPADWGGRCGFIDAEMIRREVPDYDEQVFYVCGPPAMVGCLVDILKTDLQIAEPMIRKENFSGY